MLIKDKKIDRISGPVSFALLKPKKFIFDELKKEGKKQRTILYAGLGVGVLLYALLILKLKK